MLDGLWEIKVTDTRGLSAVGLVLLQNGVILRGEESINIAGTYEENDNALLATIEVLLSASSASGDSRSLYIYLHVQGQLVAHTITASGVDLSDAWHRADVRLVRRNLLTQHHGSVKAGAIEEPVVVERSSTSIDNKSRATAIAEVGRTSADCATNASERDLSVSRAFWRRGRDRFALPGPTFRPPNIIAPLRVHVSADPQALKELL